MRLTVRCPCSVVEHRFSVGDYGRTALFDRARIVEELPDSESSSRIGGWFYRFDNGQVWHNTAIAPTSTAPPRGDN